jgi:O-antigen/teichoic acid export membrane protein
VIRAFFSSNFFRQSAWMMAATLISGGCMSLVQIIATRMPTGEALTFSMLVDLAAQLTIPVIGLQTVFAQETVVALAENRRAQLAGATRWAFKVIGVLWMIAAIAFLIFQKQFTANFRVTPLALTVTLAFGLLAMLQPVAAGLLQGKQEFSWFGLATILNGVGRLIGVTVMVLWLGGKAEGVMFAVLLGVLLTTGIIAWRTKELWIGQSALFDWRGLIKRALPISFALGAYTYLFTADSFAVKRFFTQDTDAYNSVRLIGRILVFATVPMAWVMFPLLVKSRLHGSSTNALHYTALITAGVGVLGAIGLTLLPELPLRFLANGAHVGFAWMVPWFAWCLLPLPIAHVLINNLLACERYAAVPWLAAVAVAYGIALRIHHETFTDVIKTLGLFGLLLVAVCVVFTIRQPRAGVTRH